MIAPAWALAKALAGGAWKLARAIPWQVWLAAAILAAGWQWGRVQYNAGVEACEAAHAEAQRQADEAQRERTAQRDRASTDVAADTRARAAEASAKTQTETAAAVEKVRYVTRTIEVPVGCPVGLPDVVRDEGRAAVARARAAGSAVRAGADR